MSRYANKSLPELLKIAQRHFNAFIRMRDANECCVTCGKYKIEHACHFYSAGHYSALRFTEDNCHGGCLQCNYFKHGSGNEYRRNIELRIGKERLMLLDATATRHRVKKWHRTEVIAIIEHYLQAKKAA